MPDFCKSVFLRTEQERNLPSPCASALSLCIPHPPTDSSSALGPSGFVHLPSISLPRAAQRAGGTASSRSSLCADAAREAGAPCHCITHEESPTRSSSTCKRGDVRTLGNRLYSYRRMHKATWEWNIAAQQSAGEAQQSSSSKTEKYIPQHLTVTAREGEL